MKWLLEANYIRSISRKADVNPIDTSKKYLILAPHSDDEWIGCSQIIINCPNSIICNMDMQGGDSVEVHKQRFAEMSSVADRFGRKLITISNDKIVSLQNVLDQEHPDYVLVPHFIDWHTEHHQVMNILKKLVLNERYSNKILTYQVSVPFVNRNGCLYSTMTKEHQEHKWNIFTEHYKTQNFMPVDRFKVNEYINGVYVSPYAAELYMLYDADDWAIAVDDFVKHIDKCYVLKENINSIIGIRRVVSSIYK